MSNVHEKFVDFTQKEIQGFINTFKEIDTDGDGFVSHFELQLLMEKLGEARTYIALKSIVRKVVQDGNGLISQGQFLQIFRLAVSGELVCSRVIKKLAQTFDVAKEGVLKAAKFFEEKIEEHKAGVLFETECSGNHWHNDKYGKEEKIDEKEEKKKQEEKEMRREQFLAAKKAFE
ncbi:unnamed protein product [Caenorhabditis sp. 36 PRJEB53466]|nr:unnamed protein product [Caenorhabditis sp. 36 PRJEB53466]